jgi:hypothetical protein
MEQPSRLGDRRTGELSTRWCTGLEQDLTVGVRINKLVIRFKYRICLQTRKKPIPQDQRPALPKEIGCITDALTVHDSSRACPVTIMGAVVKAKPRMPEAALTPLSVVPPRKAFLGSVFQGRSAADQVRSNHRATELQLGFPNPKTEEYDQCPSTITHPWMKTTVEDHPSVHPISNSSGPKNTSAFRPPAKAFDGCSGSLC